MKIFKLLTFAALSAVMLSSCTKDDSNVLEVQDEGLIPLNISGSINQVHTKATAEGFVDKDAVGLFAVNYESNNSVPGALLNSGNQADNVRYDFDESNHKWVPVRPVYYKNVNTHVDLFLYYPFQRDVGEVNSSSFEVQKDQSKAATSSSLSGYEASDWMWGKGTDITPSESSVRISLSHRLSAVQVTLNEGTGFDPGVFETLSKSVIVSNTTRKATLDYSTGIATPIGSAQADGIVMCSQTDGSYRAIVIPQTVTAGTSLFAITIDGISYSFKQSADVVYQPGKQINVSININKKVPTGNYELVLSDFQITDWTEDRITHGGEARQYYVVNVAEPGTLGSLIRAANKNPKKICNLKVTGTISANDFYYMRDSMTILEAINLKECSIDNDKIPANAFNNKQSLYYFVFPEIITEIDNNAFNSTNLSGALIVPNGCIRIGSSAFYGTNIVSVSFPEGLLTIGDYAFKYCGSFSGSLLLPFSVEAIGKEAFNYCKLSGTLILPDNLTTLGMGAFSYAGSFDGDLSMPPKLTSLPNRAFFQTPFTGSLYLNNVISYPSGGDNFWGCGFSGELVIPEGTQIIVGNCFRYNRITRVVLPSTLKKIEARAFSSNTICEDIVIPEGCVVLNDDAFSGNSTIPSVEFPESLVSIGSNAFANCFGITKIVSHSTEPPTVQSNTFNGVGKDNLTLEVPEQSLIRYQTETGWSDFKRISAHQDFSLSRRQLRVLNAGITKTYTLRAPSGFNWSIESKPDWVTVSPESGTGKVNVTITVSQMPRTDETFTHEVWKGGYFEQAETYKGRSGEIVFLLDDKDYRFTFSVEQFDHDYGDGDTQTFQTATIGNGVDIVLIGDGYDALDIANGKYLTDMNEAMTAFFGIEPYNTYKDYFNVYMVYGMSLESGVGTQNTIVDNKFGTTLTANRLLLQNPTSVFSEANKSPISNISKSLVILIGNTSVYEGITYMYGDGSAIAVCPKSTLAYPYDFRGIVQHEAGGHGFGKLADEYIYHNAFIQNCDCTDGCDHGKIFNQMKSNNWYRNLELTGDMNKVAWSHLIFHPKYSNVVDIFEGGYMHNRGVYRSEATSCMNNNIPYFSAISRQAIVERIMDYAGETFTLENFYANDKSTVGSKGPVRVSGSAVKWPETQVHGHNHGPVYMGEHPNVR